MAKNKTKTAARTVSKHKTNADYQAARVERAAEREKERKRRHPEERVLSSQEYAVKRAERKGESSAKYDQNAAGNRASKSSGS